MSNHTSQQNALNLIRVLKHLAREWKSLGEREFDVDDNQLELSQRYLAHPIWTLFNSIHKATRILRNDIEWVAAFIDTPLALTPWKNPGERLSISLANPELDGVPYDKVSGENRDLLRSIREELKHCDEDGRTAEILKELEAKHPGLLDNLRAEGAAKSNGNEGACADPVEIDVQPTGNRPPQYVTLDQMAALVNRSKKVLEKRLNLANSTMPRPDVEGGGGKPHEWKWSEIRPWLEKEFGKILPENYPSLRANGS